ncbi:hypothetical protein E2C01_060319 [Portunus trituberculatus]|uniref:Uncharacterized protein n=1 Tax=Portunus trituberculatus TaxID=210409 RepID=A0A5B7H7P8_PORTR|nr:hypothetical protein [Portunus trituberculatus]
MKCFEPPNIGLNIYLQRVTLVYRRDVAASFLLDGKSLNTGLPLPSCRPYQPHLQSGQESGRNPSSHQETTWQDSCRGGVEVGNIGLPTQQTDLTCTVPTHAGCGLPAEGCHASPVKYTANFSDP